MKRGLFVWNELMTRDPEGVMALYEKVVGWTFQPMEGSADTYYMAMLDGQPVAGLMPIPSDDPYWNDIPDHWLGYIDMADVDAALEVLKQAGGTVIKPPFDIPGIGRIAIVKDPSGGVVGWMTGSMSQT